jgi:hypothetical protein
MEFILEEIDYICRLKFTIMKIKYSIIFLGIILVSLFSCSDSKKKQKTDIEKENLKGDVMFIHETYSYINNKQPIISITEFNNEGKKINECRQSEYEFTWDEYQYNNDGYLENVIHSELSNDKLIEVIKRYTYDDQNRLLKINPSEYSTKSVYSKTFLYEKNELKRETTFENEKEVSCIEYYYSSQKDSSLLTNKITEYVQKNIYSKDGKIIETNVEWLRYPPATTTFYNYDDKGNEIERKTQNQTGNNIDNSLTKLNYEYDSKGNWTKKSMEENGELQTTSTRKIYYANDELTSIRKELDNYRTKLLSKNQNSEIESQDNSNDKDNSSSNTYQQPERQKQWVNCSYCRGKGEIACTKCNGTTLEFCGTCGGRGTFNGPQTCYYCKGALKVKCTNCNGKGNQGRCPRCGGRGQVQE